MVRATAVEPLEGFAVRITFTDGTKHVVDLEPYLWGPVFEGLRRAPALFRKVRVDTELGTIVWPNGADIDPDVLNGDARPEWMTDRHGPVTRGAALALGKRQRAPGSSGSRNLPV